MNADCAFWIGKTHTICQDYALAETENGTALAVLADGCSSSPNTDFGARLLAQSALGLLREAAFDADMEGPDFYSKAVAQAAECAARLGLEPTCLDATLLTIQATQSHFTVSVCGDGTVALGRHDGSMEVYTISYAANYPFYASYLLQEARKRQWDAQPNNNLTITRETRNAGASINKVQCLCEQPWQAWEHLPVSEYRFAAVLSDGVQSYARTEQTDTSRRTTPVNVEDTLDSLLAFPGLGRGQFVQRRAQAFRKQCLAAGWHHADDVSLAAIWFDE